MPDGAVLHILGHHATNNSGDNGLEYRSIIRLLIYVSSTVVISTTFEKSGAISATSASLSCVYVPVRESSPLIISVPSCAIFSDDMLNS